MNSSLSFHSLNTRIHRIQKISTLNTNLFTMKIYIFVSSTTLVNRFMLWILTKKMNNQIKCMISKYDFGKRCEIILFLRFWHHINSLLYFPLDTMLFMYGVLFDTYWSISSLHLLINNCARLLSHQSDFSM